jgi:DNA modification methylase
MTIRWQDDAMTLHHGDARVYSREIPVGSVQTIVCSPPYYGLRDYGAAEQIGNERTVQEYVDNLVGVFDAARPALTDDGTLWVVIDDAYAGRANAGRAYDGNRGMNRPKVMPPRRRTTDDAPFKSLIGAPWRFAIAMIDKRWHLRAEVIWRKTNAKPESVKDRPMHQYERVFLFSKRPRYYFDETPLLEPAKRASLARADRAWGEADIDAEPLKYTPRADGMRMGWDVWDIAVEAYEEEHYAVFPTELARRCILAGSREGDTVLDLFHGSGTTAKVALEHGRRYVGGDVQLEYLDQSLENRLRQPPLSIPVGG